MTSNYEALNEEFEAGSVSTQDQSKTFDLVYHPIYIDAKYAIYQENKFIESDITSSLTLQKLLYFNKYYSFVFFYCILAFSIYRFYIFDFSIDSIIRLILIIPWGILENARVYNGYVGNIKESFPEMVSFFLLSIANLIIIGILLVFSKKFPTELAFLIIALVFVIFEFIIAFLYFNSVLLLWEN